MKKQPFLTAQSSLIAITLIAVCAFSTVLLRAQSSEPSSNGEQEAAHAESSRERCNWRCQQGQLLEGSWDVVVTPVVPPGVPPPPSFHAYTTFSRGGGSFGSDRSRPFSKQHGVWEHLGGNRFASTFKEDLFDTSGNFAGILTVRVRTTLLGAHAAPPEYAGRADAYVDLVCEEMIPAAAREGIADAVDAFCEGIGFTQAQTW